MVAGGEHLKAHFHVKGSETLPSGGFREEEADTGFYFAIYKWPTENFYRKMPHLLTI